MMGNASIYGLPIIVSPLCGPRPKMTLSEKVPVTSEFRAYINAWMLEFFGMHDPIHETGGKLIMSHQNYRKLLDAAKVPPFAIDVLEQKGTSDGN